MLNNTYIFIVCDLYFMLIEKSRSMLTADFKLRCDKFNRDANIYSTVVSFDGIKRIDFAADRNEYFNISTGRVDRVLR